MKNSKSAAGYIVLACLLYAAFLGEAVLLWGSALPAAVLIGAAGIWLLAWFLKKLIWFPKSAQLDQEWEEKIFKTREELAVDVYAIEGERERGGRYIKTASVLPFVKKGGRSGIVFCRRFLGMEDLTQIQMTAIRELGKDRLKIPQKNLFGLIHIFLLEGDLLLLYIYNRSTGTIFPQPFWFDMVVPAALVLVLLLLLLHWNHRISIGDRQLDRFMLQYFEAEQLEAFIKKTEKEEVGSQRQEVKGMTDRYMKERIEFLKKEAKK